MDFNLIFLSPPVLPIRYPFPCSLHRFSVKYTHFTKFLQWYHFLPHSPLHISPKTYLPPPILVCSSFVPKHFSFTIPLFHAISTTFHTLFSPDKPLSYTLTFPYLLPTLFYLLKTTLAFPCSLQRISIKYTPHSLLSPYPLQQTVHLTPSCPSLFSPSTHLLFFILWSFYYRCYNMLYASFYSTKTQV